MTTQNELARALLKTVPVKSLQRGRRRSTPAKNTLSLALQGGGAHGAFTWGVLDRLLAERRFRLDGISGASAGALNAAALVSGWHEDGPAGARERLAELWRRVSDLAHYSPLRAAAPAVDIMTRFFSPYQLNPLDVNPLREVLEEVIDFERLRDDGAIKLFISATDLKRGRSRVFGNAELTCDVLLASACLPHLHKAIEIEDSHYWDGGFMANPTVFPVIFNCDSADVLIVQIDPVTAAEVPRSARQIDTRRSQIMFNAPLMRELEALAYMGQMTAGRGANPLARKVRDLRLHMIDGGVAMAGFDVSSKRYPDWHMVSQLHDHGRVSAEAWLADHGTAIGKRGTVELPGL